MSGLQPTVRSLPHLSPRSLDQLVSDLRDLEVDAVAVCLLFAFVEPAHEIRVGEAIAVAFTGCPCVAFSPSPTALPGIRKNCNDGGERSCSSGDDRVSGRRLIRAGVTTGSVAISSSCNPTAALQRRLKRQTDRCSHFSLVPPAGLLLPQSSAAETISLICYALIWEERAAMSPRSAMASQIA